MANVLWTQILGATHLARIRVGVRQAAPGIPELFTVAPERLVRHLRGQRAGDRRRPAVKLGRVEPQLRSVAATRYVEPLREGGSLPGLMEADDDGLYVAKYRGAGQGPAALVAEVVVGELARRLGLPVPELVTLGAAAPSWRGPSPTPRSRTCSTPAPGINLGVDFLPGALPFTPAAVADIDPELAADVVWLDALTTNVDRTPRNPNLLVWHGRTWLIDHGAALFRQHGARPLASTAHEPFPSIADHVLLGAAGPLRRGRRAPGRARAGRAGDRRGARARGVARRGPRRAPARSRRLPDRAPARLRGPSWTRRRGPARA